MSNQITLAIGEDEVVLDSSIKTLMKLEESLDCSLFSYVNKVMTESNIPDIKISEMVTILTVASKVSEDQIHEWIECNRFGVLGGCVEYLTQSVSFESKKND